MTSPSRETQAMEPSPQALALAMREFHDSGCSFRGDHSGCTPKFQCVQLAFAIDRLLDAERARTLGDCAAKLQSAASSCLKAGMVERSDAITECLIEIRALRTGTDAKGEVA